MYQFQNEVQRKEKIYKVYVILFIISILINVVLFFVDGSILSGIVSLLVFSIVLHYGLRKKVWAGLIVKGMVWIHIVLLFIMFLTMIIKVIQ
ncbi:hypothetical protein COF64_20755 [Bacillus sp. AFS043905]|nr:hypothetical protein COF64_20755 [Bacillus sp. AFS043905]